MTNNLLQWRKVDRHIAQQFVYDDASMEMRLGSDPAQCVTVAEQIDDAGPYQSRDLILAPCGALGKPPATAV